MAEVSFRNLPGIHLRGAVPAPAKFDRGRLVSSLFHQVCFHDELSVSGPLDVAVFSHDAPRDIPEIFSTIHEAGDIRLFPPSTASLFSVFSTLRNPTVIVVIADHKEVDSQLFLNQSKAARLLVPAAGDAASMVRLECDTSSTAADVLVEDRQGRWSELSYVQSKPAGKVAELSLRPAAGIASFVFVPAVHQEASSLKYCRLRMRSTDLDLSWLDDVIANLDAWMKEEAPEVQGRSMSRLHLAIPSVEVARLFALGMQRYEVFRHVVVVSNDLHFGWQPVLSAAKFLCGRGSGVTGFVHADRFPFVDVAMMRAP